MEATAVTYKPRHNKPSERCTGYRPFNTTPSDARQTRGITLIPRDGHAVLATRGREAVEWIHSDRVVTLEGWR